MIGDSLENDIAGAKNAGWKTIWMNHHRYTVQEVEKFAAKAKKNGAELLLTTEKDAVRIPTVKHNHLPFYYLRIQIDILSGQESFDQCISRICFM